MSSYLSDEQLDRLPPGIRMKISELPPNAIERIKDRVHQQARNMTAKKEREIRRAQEVKVEALRRRGLLGEVIPEADQQAKAAEIMQQAPPQEVFEKQPYPAPWPPEMDVPDSVIRFTPKEPGELVNIPISMKEGVKKQLVDRYGYPDDQADVIASNAIDNWVKIVPPPEPTPVAQAMVSERVYEPALLIHPFSPVAYPPDEFGTTLGRFGEEPVSTQSAPASAGPVEAAVPLTPITTAELQTQIDAGKEEARKQGLGWVVPVAIVAGLIFFATKGGKRR